MTTENRK